MMSHKRLLGYRGRLGLWRWTCFGYIAIATRVGGHRWWHIVLDSGSVCATLRRGQRSLSHPVFLASYILPVSSLSIDAKVHSVSHSLDAWTCRRDSLTLFSGEHGLVQVFLYRGISATNDTALWGGVWPNLLRSIPFAPIFRSD